MKRTSREFINFLAYLCTFFFLLVVVLGLVYSMPLLEQLRLLGLCFIMSVVIALAMAWMGRK